ncbi:MAG: hypothetical protein IKN34_12910 [Treponema sp.]|nr:hypothetical protein [Treponema sp.]
MDFTFSIPQNVVFGAGSLSKLPEIATKLKKSKALIISGPHLENRACRKMLRRTGNCRN